MSLNRSWSSAASWISRHFTSAVFGIFSQLLFSQLLPVSAFEGSTTAILSIGVNFSIFLHVQLMENWSLPCRILGPVLWDPKSGPDSRRSMDSSGASGKRLRLESKIGSLCLLKSFESTSQQLLSQNALVDILQLSKLSNKRSLPFLEVKECGLQDEDFRRHRNISNSKSFWGFRHTLALTSCQRSNVLFCLLHIMKLHIDAKDSLLFDGILSTPRFHHTTHPHRQASCLSLEKNEKTTPCRTMSGCWFCSERDTFWVLHGPPIHTNCMGLNGQKNAADNLTGCSLTQPPSAVELSLPEKKRRNF